ncbi:MAG TPA: NAD(P)-binding domain-containing protein [Daejeonella sp.]|nr:NAD(P)-binding domain-containing protein [Daejeonella sp.]
MKKIGILGTGMVGNTIGTKLVELDYTVMMGSRSANNEKAQTWAVANGANALTGTFEEAAKFGEIIFNCTKGEASLEAIKMAGLQHFGGKTVVDIANPLDFSKGMPPSLLPKLSNTNSLGEEIQKLIPEANVVKSLNIVNCEVMVDARRSGGDATMFVCGNNADAKEELKAILLQFNWTDIIDLGDISNARGTEMLLPIWLRIWNATGNGHFAFKIVR